ncbi:histone acetyltransferase KAT7 [Rhagoletis pomonella]|uniref:histone acetyltransferase KAT7 n=1 Tax=Rhagoletis pomonella TaxID=28610 RepID=UPI00177F2172|nr:histone acetyltransferase KAT7 [Rhagoletis pomonella]
MSTFRKKSTSTTGTSSSSTSGSSTSGSTSCSNSGSSSSDTESSSSGDEKSVVDDAPCTVAATKTQVTTRRKSSEFKGAAKADAEKLATSSQSTSKTRLSNSNTASLRQPRAGNHSSDDELPPSKKSTRPVATSSTTQKRKLSASSTSAAQNQSNQRIIGGKAPQNTLNKLNSHTNKAPAGNSKAQNSLVPENGQDGKKNTSTAIHGSDESDREVFPSSRNKSERKGQVKLSAQANSAAALNSSENRIKQARPKTQTKRTIVGKAKNKSSEEDEEESESESGKTTTTESEATESSNSYDTHPVKSVKGKRAPTAAKIANSDSDDGAPRKLTRSLSTRRSRQQPKSSGGAGCPSESESEVDLDTEKHSLSKSPAKRCISSTGGSKCKVKKEAGVFGSTSSKPRSLSPPQQMEKKCPIEGCDSSGHLCGNLDRHFLPEACPIYHNMSASECKERVPERKLRNERRLRNSNSNLNNSDVANPKGRTNEQNEFLAKIRESRVRFRPIAATINTDKVKLEKDCTDEDREPNLIGLVPDYDLQLFRDAQAIASEKVEDELKDLPVGKGIKYITMGKYRMKVWYQSPYPDDAARLPQMNICEFCLRYQKSETGIKRHAEKCVWRHPPGDEIYRKGKLQVWQVDGKRHKQYCQHLCLLAKFFLDHKTLYYDVEPFLFYIMTLADVDGCHTVGYFSKEKNSFYNVSCILTLPPYQRKGYGRLLIDFSYLLTRVEGKIGSPEKPLSDLGLISYRSYWKDVLLDYLCSRTGSALSIKDVSQETAIYSYDIVSTLQALGMMKYWKGKHIVLKKQEVLDEYEKRVNQRGNFPKIDDSCLRWSPFVPTQTNNSP